MVTDRMEMGEIMLDLLRHWKRIGDHSKGIIIDGEGEVPDIVYSPNSTSLLNDREKKKLKFIRRMNIMPKCHFCKKEIDDNSFCYGCNSYVCDECDQEEPVGQHDVEDHRSPVFDG